ncbi:MAG: hypothetical protein AAGJ52_09775, partial [Pseudomonadota bacterium]
MAATEDFEVVDLAARSSAEEPLALNKELMKEDDVAKNTYETSLEASAAMLAKLPEDAFATKEEEHRFGLALLLKSYVPNVDCESLVNDARYGGVAVVDK